MQRTGRLKNSERAGTTPVFAPAQPFARASFVLVVPALSRSSEYLQVQTSDIPTID